MQDRQENSYPSITLADCTACLMCVDVCPTGALGIVTRNGVRGFRRYPKLLYEENCVSCGACSLECAFGAISMKHKAGVSGMGARS